MRTDFKPAKRVKDAEVYRLFHGHDRRCVCCSSAKVEAHHILHRSQGGDDIEANLAPLCKFCHTAHHSRSAYLLAGQHVTYEKVDAALARYIRSSDAAQAYLIAKLKPFGAERFVQKLEGK